MTAPSTSSPSCLKRLWRQRVADLIMAQLIQGVTPQKIALTVALGFSLGVFPILGATTMLCAIAGLCLKLNQPVIQLVNWAVSPLQISMILIFVRFGEWLTRARPVDFSVSELVETFHRSPSRFFQEFGFTGLHGIIAWLAIAPPLTVVIYFTTLPLLKRFSRGQPPSNHRDA